MAFTIPEYVDTQEQAILAVASAVKGEQVTGGDGSVNTALDILADALAGENVEVPMTQQGAILALAQYVGGGGGGVDVGAPSLVVKKNRSPEVAEFIPGSGATGGLAIGETVIVPVDPDNSILAVAAGMTATTAPDIDLSPTTCDAYVVTVVNEEITASEQWSGTLTPGTYTTVLGPFNVWTFTVPALEYDFETRTGKALYLYMH